MNCAECRELLVVYLEGLLEDSQKQAVEAHLNICESCRTEREGLQTLQRRLVRNGEALAQKNLENEVMNRIIREQNVRLKSAAQAGMGLRIRRLIMKSAIVKTAVAAAVVLAGIGAFCLWSGTQPNVALADVLTKVEQAQAFLYKITMHMKGNMQGMAMPNATDMQGTILVANEYGMRMDMSMTDPTTGRVMNQQMYLLPEQKMMMMVMPEMKTYMRMTIDESMFEKARKQNNDPRMMIKQILACQYQGLGKSVIDGVEVEGFQTTDPAYVGNALGKVDVKIWVDMKTWLPVRMDMHIKASEEIEMEATLYDFEWELPVSAAEFNPVLPADYKAGPGDGLTIPPMTEETAVAGLKLCVAIMGRYPENLNMMTLIQVTMQELKTSQTPEAQKFRQMLEQAKNDEERAKAVVEPMMPIQMLGGFYATLVQEQKDPAYYGKTVTPAEAGQVLMRWKTADNEYRVLFGDLRAETVTAEKLSELEAGLPK